MQSLSTTEQRLVDVLRQAIRAELEILVVRFEKKNSRAPLTRKEAAAALKIDLSTLWRWEKVDKIITGFRNRKKGRVYFPAEEVERCRTAQTTTL